MSRPVGLDSVELVMEFEEVFGINIPDDVAERMLTIGDVAVFMTRMTAAPIKPIDPDVLRRVIDIVCDQLGVAPEGLSPATRFVKDLDVG